MQSSLGEARSRKTTFTPRTGGNQYKIVKPEDVLVETQPASQQTVDASSQEAAPASSTTSTKKSTQNLDFLLGRALESTVHQMSREQQ